MATNPDRDPVEVEADALMEVQVLSIVPDTKGQHHVIDYLPMRDAIATALRAAEARGAGEDRPPLSTTGRGSE